MVSLGDHRTPQGATATRVILATFRANGLLLAAGGLLGVLVAPGPHAPSADLEGLRTRWLGGHLVGTAVALACFALATVV
jgi:hypothetical protein